MNQIKPKTMFDSKKKKKKKKEKKEKVLRKRKGKILVDFPPYCP